MSKEEMNIQFMSKPYGSYKRTWAAFIKRRDDRKEMYKFIIKRDPCVMTMINSDTMEEFFYPELGGIGVHKNEDLTQYKTAEEAYDVAVEIREYLKQEMEKL